MCDGPNPVDYFATVEVVDNGLGTEEVNALITNCTTEPVNAYLDCCSGGPGLLERLEADGAWYLVPSPGWACDCDLGPPVPIPAGEIRSVPAWPYDPDLCASISSATYRWRIALWPETCTGTGLPCATVEVVSQRFGFYCEG